MARESVGLAIVSALASALVHSQGVDLEVSKKPLGSPFKGGTAKNVAGGKGGKDRPLIGCQVAAPPIFADESGEDDLGGQHTFHTR